MSQIKKEEMSALHDQINELLKQFKNVEWMLITSIEETSVISGNSCAVCSTARLMDWIDENDIKHIVGEDGEDVTVN